jgi:hypothetical protein
LYEHLDWLNNNNTKQQNQAVVYMVLWFAEKNARTELGDETKELKELAKIRVFLEKISAAQETWRKKCTQIRVQDLQKIEGPF